RLVTAQGASGESAIEERFTAWQMAAAGGELAVALDEGPITDVYVSSGGGFQNQRFDGRVLIGAGGGHVVAYQVAGGELTVAPERAGSWTAHVGRPACFAAGAPPKDGSASVWRAPTVTSVVGLRGGYAR